MNFSKHLFITVSLVSFWSLAACQEDSDKFAQLSLQEKEEKDDSVIAKIAHGLHSIQGRRYSQQDAHDHIEADNFNLFILCDGHGQTAQRLGCRAELSEWNKTDLKRFEHQHSTDEFVMVDAGAAASGIAVETIKKYFEENDFELTTVVTRLHEAVNQAEHTLSALSRSPYNQNGHEVYPSVTWGNGTTLLLGLLCENIMTICWAGDSRATCVRDGRAIWCSRDHNPSDSQEVSRIAAAQKKYEQEYGKRCPLTVYDNRIGGSLAVSRALGDFYLKQRGSEQVEALTHQPEVVQIKTEPGDTWVLCCDGVHESFTSPAIGDFIAEQDTLSPQELAEKLVTEAHDKGSRDNISAWVIQIPGEPVANTPLEIISAKDFATT